LSGKWGWGAKGLKTAEFRGVGGGQKYCKLLNLGGVRGKRIEIKKTIKKAAYSGSLLFISILLITEQ